MGDQRMRADWWAIKVAAKTNVGFSERMAAAPLIILPADDIPIDEPITVATIREQPFREYGCLIAAPVEEGEAEVLVFLTIGDDASVLAGMFVRAGAVSRCESLVWIVNRGGMFAYKSNLKNREESDSLAGDVLALLDQVHKRMCRRMSYAVEVRNTSPRTMASKKPWTRDDLRTIILSGSMDEIVTRCDSQGSNNGHPRAPHRRRGHWNLLRSERYRHKRGQHVWVRDAWVGPTEWEAGGKTYRVIE